MSVRAARLEEIVPTPDNGSDAKVLSFLKKHEDIRGQAPTPTYFLSGGSEGDYIELTPRQHQMLKRVLELLSDGQPISIAPRNTVLTTQEAAEILGISRPTVVSLIDKGELTAYVPGARNRRLLLSDVLRYREELSQKRAQFLDETTDEFEDLSPEYMAALLREARKKA